MLRGLVNPEKPLTAEQEAHIDTLQSEIDEIWNRRGDYKIDPDAWETMPFFMEHISEEDVEKNAQCAALASIVYDEMPPDEMAENRKEHGNKALVMALNPAQERRENLARAACYSYTEALQAKLKDTKLACTIYANRCLAQFIIGNYGHGLEDGQRAIILDPTYRKAYYRTAKCAERVRKFDLALRMIEQGLAITEPPIDDAARREFEELRALVEERKRAADGKAAQSKRTERVQAAKVSNMALAISRLGVRISPIAEVTSEQMGAYGNPAPYFESGGLLHVPVLFVYDEFQQTDMAHDVACDVSVGEMVEQMLPFPWDTQGRYRTLDDLVVLYKIDDGVKMPEYYEVDLSWPLLEVFRSETYAMPKLLPVLHILCKSSELLTREKVHRRS